MYNNEHTEQVQNDERLVIESIFGDDAKFPVSKWKVWRPIEVTIHLEPQTCSSIDKENRRKISLDFHVTCNKEYPNSIPNFEIINENGISQEASKKMLELITAKSKSLLGKVMILELCNIIREFLTNQDSRPVGSFHDNMMKKKANEVDECNRRRLDSERRELALVAEEQEKIAIERQKRNEGGSSTKRIEGECQMIGGRRIVVLANIPVKRKRPNSICHEWMGFWENQQLLISEWSFRYTLGRNANDSKKRDFGPFVKRLDEVCDELNSLCHFCKPDPNLVEYAFIHVHKESVTESNLSVKVFVAQKIYPEEENMQDVYEMVATNSSLLRRLAAQAVCGLRYLHEQQLTHSALNMSTVWLRENVFRFSDFRTLYALSELAASFHDIVMGKKHLSHEKHEETEKPRKKDIFQLGTLLDELMIAGRTSAYSRIPTPDLPTGSTLSKFIAKCQGAKNIDELVDDSFLNHELPLSGCDEIFTSFGCAMDRHSRVMQEFVVIRMLGKGGFGDVLLARNKLDSMDYAVKRIPLNAENERLNRRIKKEAKLFAKLNHPNVVRYFSAWVEDLNPIHSEVESSDDSLGAVPIPGRMKKKPMKKVELQQVPISDSEEDPENSLLPPKLREIERVAAAARLESRKMVPETSEWSTSYKLRRRKSSSSDIDSYNNRGRYSKKSNTTCSGIHHSSGRVQTLFSPPGLGSTLRGDELDNFWEESEKEDDEDEDEEEEDEMGENLCLSDVSDSDIVFGDESDGNRIECGNEPEMELSRNSMISSTKILRPKVLIIQMEYCEKGTLRQSIDDGVIFSDPANIWRVLSEILCGLQYIHDQGMIHRDIKPMNIFLNSQQSVKIGDFGLATRELYQHKKSDKSTSFEGSKDIKGGSDQTRDIGTQLYMAPELFDKELMKAKKPYTSKIDVYSAGVVLFEMIYKPLPPGMERISTLNALRTEVKIPNDFGANLPSLQKEMARKVIEWMLKRNPDERPTVHELINEENLPMNKGEDSQFEKQFSRFLKKKGSRMHGWIMDMQFDEECPVAVNYCFDVEICKERFLNTREPIIEKLQSEFKIVLDSHAYEVIPTHTLVPASTAKAAAPVRQKPAEFLNRKGIAFSLPIDLRQTFVRYCVRNAVNRLKRYSFGKVYWVDDLKFNTHPQERLECSVDSIGPQSASVSLDAELLLTACQIVSSSLRGLKIILRIGHIQIIEAVLRHLRISDEFRSVVLNILHCFSTSDKIVPSVQKINELGQLIGVKTATSLITNLPCETTLSKFREALRFLSKSRDETVRNSIEKVLKELEDIYSIFSIGASEEVAKISVMFDAQTSYRPRTFGDGLVFQILAEIPNKRGVSRNVSVVAGGQYDSLLLRERHPRDIPPPMPQCLSGFAVSMDVIAEIRKRIPSTGKVVLKSCSTLICSMAQEDNSILLAEKFKLAKALWGFNLQADVLHEPVTSLDSLHEHCEKKSISHLLLVCNSVPDIFVRSHETNIGKMDMEKAIATICREIKICPSISSLPSLMPQENTLSQSEKEDHLVMTPLSASRSVSASLMGPSDIFSVNRKASLANINLCIAVNDRLSGKDKKRIEMVVKNHLDAEISVYGGRTKIEVIVCDLGKDIIKQIVGELTKNSTCDEITILFNNLSRQHHGKKAKELDALSKQLLPTIQSARPQSHNPIVIIVYGIGDNFYRVLT